MAAEVPLKLVDWKGFGSVTMFAGPRPLPLTTKMLPGAIDPLGNGAGVLLAAFATLVLHHAVNPGVALQEIARILKPGGTLPDETAMVGPCPNGEVQEVTNVTPCL